MRLPAAACSGTAPRSWRTSLETRSFHDFYPARAHLAWLTQGPVLLLVHAGVRDTHLLAIAFSATLFAVPAALYHLALARVRDKGALLAAVIAVIATVYLPTCFFIVGEYNIAYAAVTAAFAIALTGDGADRRDGGLLLALGLLCIASYEAMIYLGPLGAAMIVWSARRGGEPVGRLLALAAALAFLGATVVSGSTVIEYWNHRALHRGARRRPGTSGRTCNSSSCWPASRSSPLFRSSCRRG